jgi:putative tryptophan/tyrosine transport system substrate-binding protein
MRRREFIAGLAGAASWWTVARAQQPAMPVVGFVYGGSASAGAAALFRKGLGETGYFENRNVTVEYHWLEGQYDRLTALASDLVHRPVSAIVAASTPVALAAKTATTSIPIVFHIGGDPVKLGLVASYNRPGANVTGISIVIDALAAKKLELLHQLLPQATAIAMLVNPSSRDTAADAAEAQSAARILGLRVLVLDVSDQNGIEAAFATLVQERVGALLVGFDPLFVASSEQLISLAARHRIPMMFNRREFVSAGGLLSYGASFSDAMRQAGIYTGRILRGEKPACYSACKIDPLSRGIGVQN